MAINVQKLVPSSFSSQQVSQEKLIEVKRSVIDIEKLMTGIIAFEKKQQDVQRQAREEKRYQRREDQLEKKQTKKEFKLDLPTLPRMGFFDWIKNFVTNTLLGFFAVRLLKYVPQLVGVAGVAMNAAEGILNFAGGLLNGAATFVEWGYKAYDATRGFLKQIGGDNVTKLFDKFLGGLDLFLTLSLGASLITGFDKFKKSVGDTAKRGLFRGAQTQLARGTGAAAQRARSVTFAQRRTTAGAIRQSIAGRRTRVSVGRQGIRKRLVASRVEAQRVAELTARAGANKIIRSNQALAIPEVAAAVRDQRLGFVNPRQSGLLKRLSELDRSIEKNEIDGDFVARGKNLTERNNILEKIKKGGISPRKRVRKSPIVKGKPSEFLYPKGIDGTNILTPRGTEYVTIPDPSNPGKNIKVTVEEAFMRIEGVKGTDYPKPLPSDIPTPSRQEVSSMKGMPSPAPPSVIPPRVAKLSGTKLFLRQAKGILGRFKIPIIGGLIDFALSVALGENPGRAAFRAIGAGLLGGVLGAAGSVVPVVGNFIGGLVGGAVGDMIGGALYDLFFENKKPQIPQQKTQGYASGGEVRRGPQKRIKKRREYLAEPTQDPVEPGKDVGKNKFEEMFPRGSGGFLGIGSKKDAYGYLESGYNLLSGAGFFGPLFGIAIKALTGDKPSSTDYRSASFALSNWMTSTFGNVAMQGYANGGLVGGNMFLDSRQIQRTIESSLEETVTSEVDDAINELRRRLGIEDKEGKEGKEGKPGKGQGAGKTSDFTVPMSAKGAFGVTQYITGDRSYGGDGGQFYYDSSHGGGNYHEHLGFASKEARDRAIAHLENLGYYIGSMNDGRHTAKSLHYQDRAFDVPFYPNQSNLGYTDDREGEEKFSQDVRNALGLFPGGPTGKGGLFNLHENEWVVDFDSRKLYGDAFLHIMNATENESQRKQNSLRLISMLQTYAGYESGFEQTVIVPVPAPQMIPVPIPMQSNEPMMMPSGGGSSGRASDILESIG